MSEARPAAGQGVRRQPFAEDSKVKIVVGGTPTRAVEKLEQRRDAQLVVLPALLGGN
jgi:hypothetical protein